MEKSKYIMIGITILLLFSILYVGFNSNKNNEPNEVSSSSQNSKTRATSIFFGGVAKEKVKTTMSSEVDMMPVDFESLASKCELVVIGTFKKRINTQSIAPGVVLTKSEFHIKSVLKGDTSEDENINISFGGGVLPISEYKKQFSAAAIKKDGLDQYDEGYISLNLGDAQAYPISNTDYLIFAKKGEYGLYLYGERYSLYEINAGKVHHEVMNEDLSLSEIQELISKNLRI